MIQTASIVGLLKTLLIFFLIYTLFKYVMRLFAPILLKSMLNKASKSFGQHHKTQTNPKEGEVTIDKMPGNNNSNKDVGDYVDYEEIE
jgi:hypothetical protein